LGDLQVTYMVYLRLVGKRVVDFLLLIIELFSPAVKVKDIRRNRSGRKERKVGHFERKFQREEGGLSPTALESLGYHVVLFASSFAV